MPEIAITPPIIQENSWIESAAYSVTTQTALYCTMGALTFPFLPTTATLVPLLYFAGSTIVCSSSAKISAEYFKDLSVRWKQNPEMALSKKIYKKTAEILNFFSSIAFGYFHVHTTGSLIHEAGHALTGMILFQNANPRIMINPLEKIGLSKISAKNLSFLGNCLGKNKARLLVTVAGPLTAFLFSLGSIIAASYLPDSYQQTKLFLLTSAIASITIHIFDAFSALSIPPSAFSANDFAVLSFYGLNPAIAAISMLAISVFTLVG